MEEWADKQIVSEDEYKKIFTNYSSILRSAGDLSKNILEGIVNYDEA